MIKSNGGIIGPDNVTTGGAFGSASGVFKLGEVTNLIKESKWPTAGPQGFQVVNSLRFNSGSSDYLTKTPSGTGNRQKFTISAWVKRGKLGSEMGIFSGGPDSNASGFYTLMFDDADKLRVEYYDGAFYNIMPNMLFRDPSAWYHIVVSNDTTNSTSADRTKIYVNGVQQAVVNASGSTADQPNINFNYNVNNDSLQQVGARRNSGGSPAGYFDGYIAEFCMIDGQQLAPTSFGEENSQTGIWVPKIVTGLTFGTNGFYQNYSNSGALGEDFSGNDNDYAVNNLTSIDQSTDTCSTNGSVWNNLLGIQIPDTFSEGNLVLTMGQNAWRTTFSTIAASSGKFYAEVKWVTGSEFTAGFGNAQSYAVDPDLNDLVADPGGDGYVSVIYKNGVLYENGSNTGTGYSTYSSGNIIMLAMDLDNYKLYLGVNGTWGKSGDPANNSNGVAIPSANQGDFFHFAVSTYGNTQVSGNFGSPAFAISSGNTDQNGFGNFEYAVPTGFLSLNTKNLAAVLA